MRTYDCPGAREDEICIGFHTEAFVNASVWDYKRQDKERLGKPSPQGRPSFATFIKRQEALDAGLTIFEPDEWKNEEEGGGEFGTPPSDPVPA